MPQFWVGFSKQRKKPGPRRSSNCVQNAFFQLSPSGGNEKTPLGSNFTISVSCHHFGWAFPSSRNCGVRKGRPISFKTRFLNFPHRGETRKHPRDRILQFRFHATILGGLFQAAEKVGWTKVDQLRSKRVFSTFPIGAKRKNTLRIEFYNFGCMPPFWVGFLKQRKKPGVQRSSKCVQNAFFQLSPSGRNEKTPLGSNFTISVSCHHFGWAFPSSRNCGVRKGRPISFKTRFLNFPDRGETRKHPRDRILQFRFHATILGGLFQAAEKVGWTKVDQLRSKRVFSTFPIGAKRKNTLRIEFYNFGCMPPFWVGFLKQRKKPGVQRSSKCVQNAFFQLSPSGRNEKTPLGSNFTISVSCHHFGWVFWSSGRSRVYEGRPIAFKMRFFNFPRQGETKKHFWDRILQFRFHATILGGLFQAAEKPEFTKVVQLRSKRVFSTFPIGAKRKNTLGFEFYNFGFMAQFRVGFSKQRKKPGLRRSSNCVRNAFFQLSPSGRNGKTPLGSNFTISVWCHHFGWAFPSSGKSRIDEGRPIAFKTRFLDFPHRGETKKHPWDRILQFRFHTSILGELFQAAEKAGFTKVVQLRSKHVFSTFPIGAKRENTLIIEFYSFGFMPPFWVGFSKQRKKPGSRRSTNYVQNAFFQLSPSGRNEKTPLGSNFTISVLCHHFWWAFPSSGKSRVYEGRPIAFKTRFFNFPHRGETKKHPWDRILQFWFYGTILGELFQAAEKAGWTKVVQLRSKPLFFNFPHRGETKKHPWDRILQFRFHATILGGLFQAAEKAGLTKVDQLRSKRVFSTFPIGAKRKNTPEIEFYNFGFMPPFWVGFTKQRKKPGSRRSTNCVQNAFFQLSPSGRNEKTPLGSNFTISVLCHHFGWAFPSSGKSRVYEGRPIAFKTRFFNFPHRGETKKHPWDRILQFRFYGTILGELFQAVEKAGWTKVVQLRSKRVFSTFPIGAKRKNTLGIEFYNFGFMPPFWVGFSKQQKKPGWRRSTNYVQNAFFQLSPSGRNEKTPLGSNFTISVSCHHFGWALPSSGKSRFTKVDQLRSKGVFSTFPIGAKQKNTLGIEFYNFGFMPPFWVAFSKQRKKPGVRKSSNCVQNAFFQLSPSGRNKKTPLGSNFTISVSCHHFGWALPSSGKSRIDEDRPIAFKTGFFNFPHRGETKTHPWDRILQFLFHASILGELFKAAEKAGFTKVVQLRSKHVFSTFPIGAKRENTLRIEFYSFGFMPPFWVGFSKQQKKPEFTKVVQLRSKRVFSTFPIGAKRKNTLGIEFYNFGFMPPFWVAFSKQRMKPGVRKSSNCVQNAFFQLSPSGRNKKTPLGSNFKISVSCHHFGWLFRSSGRSRVYESRPIAFKMRFFNFPRRGETKKHPWDRILQFRFHATILGGLCQAAEKAGLTKIVQLRSKRVFSTFPIGAKRKHTLGIEFYNFCFMPAFWVSFSRQRKEPGLRRSSNCVQNTFFQLSPSGRNEKTPLGSNFTVSVSCHHFGWAFPSSGKNRSSQRSSNCVQNAFFQLSPSGRNEKTPLGSNFTISVSCHHFGWLFRSSGRSRVYESRPIAFKMRFFNFPHRGETKKHPWDRILQFRFHATILGGLCQAAEKAGLTKIVQLRSKRVFSTFPIGAKRKNTLGIEFYNFCFMPAFWVSFSRQRKKPGLRRSSNCVQNTFFQLSPSGRNEKTPLGSNFTVSVSCHHFGWAFPSSGKNRSSQRSSNCDQNAFFQLSPSGRNEKTPLGSNFTISVSCHHFGWLFRSSGRSQVYESRPIAFKMRFFNFPSRGETKKHPWDRILQFRFHATILGGLCQAAEKAGLTKIVQLRSKRVFSTFPIGAKRKNTLGIEFYNFGFMPPFWVAFSKQRKKPGVRKSSNCVQNAFFQLSPSGRNKKTPLGSNFTISVSCHHFGWALPSSGKSRIDEDRPIAFKTRFFNFPHRGETKKHPWDRILQFLFHASILGELFKAAEKAGFTKVVQLRSKHVFSTFPIGAQRENTLRIEFYSFGFMPPFWVGFSKQRKKPEFRKVVQLRSKRVFSTFPIGAKRENTLRIEFYSFGFMPPFWVGFSKQRKKPEFTKVIQLRSKRVFSTFPIGGKRKNTLGIEFYNFGFMAQFRVGFSKQRKKPGWRRSSNCIPNAFFQLFPSGRNEKTPLGSNLTISVSCHHFGWAFPSSGKSRVDEGRPITFKTRFFNFPHRGETKKHAWDRILQFRFHATILGELFQAAEKAGFTKVVQLRSKRVFSTFPIGAKRENTLGIEFYNFGFMPPFWVGFSKQRKKPGSLRSSNCV